MRHTKSPHRFMHLGISFRGMAHGVLRLRYSDGGRKCARSADTHEQENVMQNRCNWLQESVIAQMELMPCLPKGSQQAELQVFHLCKERVVLVGISDGSRGSLNGVFLQGIPNIMKIRVHKVQKPRLKNNNLSFLLVYRQTDGQTHNCSFHLQSMSCLTWLGKKR